MPDPTSDDLPIGRRIAIHRRRLGLTQEGLAMRLAAHTATGDDARAANRVLSLLYQMTQEVMARLGEPDLSWIAAHHSVLAAEDADDRLLAAAGAWRVCHAVLRVDDLDQVHDTATSAVTDLRRGVPRARTGAVVGGRCAAPGRRRRHRPGWRWQGGAGLPRSGAQQCPAARP